MKIYMVKKGDTLSGIAAKHGVTVQDLLAYNPGITNPDVIDVGMKIKIPSAKAPAGDWVHQHKVVQGDTLWKLSKAWGVPLEDMIKANPQLKNPNVLMTGEIVNIPKTAGHMGAGGQAGTDGSHGGKAAGYPPELTHVGVDYPVPGKKFTGVKPDKTPTAPIEQKKEKPVEQKMEMPKPIEWPKEKLPEAKPIEQPKPIELPKPEHFLPAKKTAYPEKKTQEAYPVEDKAAHLFKQIHIPALETFTSLGEAKMPAYPAAAYGDAAHAPGYGAGAEAGGQPAAFAGAGSLSASWSGSLGGAIAGAWPSPSSPHLAGGETAYPMPMPMPAPVHGAADYGMHHPYPAGGEAAYPMPAAGTGSHDPYAGMQAHAHGWPHGYGADMSSGYGADPAYGGMPHGAAHGMHGYDAMHGMHGYGPHAPGWGAHPAAGWPMHPCPCGGYRYPDVRIGEAPAGSDTDTAAPEARSSAAGQTEKQQSRREKKAAIRSVSARKSRRLKQQPAKKRGSRPWINR